MRLLATIPTRPTEIAPCAAGAFPGQEGGRADERKDERQGGDAAPPPGAEGPIGPIEAPVARVDRRADPRDGMTDPGKQRLRVSHGRIDRESDQHEGQRVGRK